jgi:hypothetical protein
MYQRTLATTKDKWSLNEVQFVEISKTCESNQSEQIVQNS